MLLLKWEGMELPGWFFSPLLVKVKVKTRMKLSGSHQSLSMNHSTEHRLHLLQEECKGETFLPPSGKSLPWCASQWQTQPFRSSRDAGQKRRYSGLLHPLRTLSSPTACLLVSFPPNSLPGLSPLEGKWESVPGSAEWEKEQAKAQILRRESSCFWPQHVPCSRSAF